MPVWFFSSFFFFNDTATTEIYTLSLHDALPIYSSRASASLSGRRRTRASSRPESGRRSEEHTSELQSLAYLVCRLLLEKKKKHESNHTVHDAKAPLSRDAPASQRTWRHAHSAQT